MVEHAQIQENPIHTLKNYTDELSECENAASKLCFTVKKVENPTVHRLSNLRNEVKLLQSSKLTHPNIITLLSSKETPNLCTLYYEHCNNGPLSQHSKIEPLKIFRQICLGVGYLHRKSIIHKNLSIQNVFIHKNIAKISNFELAEVVNSLLQDEPIPQEILNIIDPDWLPPEIKAGHQFSKQSDIWNLGLIFYYLVFRQNYKFNPIPENLKQQYKDIFAMTLNASPEQRANIESVLKKVEERVIREPPVTGSCSCFSRIFLKSSKSTLILVQKALNSEFKSTNNAIMERLFEKVAAKPEKIDKFFAELLNLKELNNDTIRTKAFTLLFLYIKQGPIMAYEKIPGVLEVIDYFEEAISKIPLRDRNEDLIITSHFFSTIIKIKFYIIRNHYTLFNGSFKLTFNSSKSDTNNLSKELIHELLDYWGVLLSFHGNLLKIAHHKELNRFIRLIIGEEQANLHKLMHMTIENFQNDQELSSIVRIYCNNLCQAKEFFKQDQIEFPMFFPEQQPLNILDDADVQRSFSFVSSNEVKHPYNSRRKNGFAPVDLDLIEKSSSVIQIVEKKSRPPTEYGTARKDFSSANSVHVPNLPKKPSIDPIFKLRPYLTNYIVAYNELKFLRQIGSGSSCEVWLGVYKKNRVAIKKQKSNENPSIKEFYRELNAFINLRHPNLVIFMGVCLETPLCLLIEYCAGGDLFTYLHKRKNLFITWEQKLIILKEITKGMLYLHSNSFIHRDLKSLNVLLYNEVNKDSDKLVIKITDFGLTREFKDGDFMTGQLGTCHWMAPEVLSSSAYSTKADVYSFGIVMFEVITRETPYKGKSHEEIRTQILHNGLRPDLDLVPPQCPQTLKSLMKLCWDGSCEKRPGFNDVLDILESVRFKNDE